MTSVIEYLYPSTEITDYPVRSPTSFFGRKDLFHPRRSEGFNPVSPSRNTQLSENPLSILLPLSRSFQLNTPVEVSSNHDVVKELSLSPLIPKVVFIHFGFEEFLLYTTTFIRHENPF